MICTGHKWTDSMIHLWRVMWRILIVNDRSIYPGRNLISICRAKKCCQQSAPVLSNFIFFIFPNSLLIQIFSRMMANSSWRRLAVLLGFLSSSFGPLNLTFMLKRTIMDICGRRLLPDNLYQRNGIDEIRGDLAVYMTANHPNGLTSKGTTYQDIPYNRQYRPVMWPSELSSKCLDIPIASLILSL